MEANDPQLADACVIPRGRYIITALKKSDVSKIGVPSIFVGVLYAIARLITYISDIIYLNFFRVSSRFASYNCDASIARAVINITEALCVTIYLICLVIVFVEKGQNRTKAVIAAFLLAIVLCGSNFLGYELIYCTDFRQTIEIILKHNTGDVLCNGVCLFLPVLVVIWFWLSKKLKKSTAQKRNEGKKTGEKMTEPESTTENYKEELQSESTCVAEAKRKRIRVLSEKLKGCMNRTKEHLAEFAEYLRKKLWTDLFFGVVTIFLLFLLSFQLLMYPHYAVNNNIFMVRQGNIINQNGENYLVIYATEDCVVSKRIVKFEIPSNVIKIDNNGKKIEKGYLIDLQHSYIVYSTEFPMETWDLSVNDGTNNLFVDLDIEPEWIINEGEK